MALNSMGLGVTFTARDAMSGVLFRLQRAFSGLDMQSRTAVAAVGAGFAGMAVGIGVVTAGLAGLEGSMNLAAQAGNFESQLLRVGQVAGVAGPQLDAMRDAAMNASQHSGFDTTQVNKGLEEIAALGFSGAQAVAMLGPALDLAAAGGISVSDAAEAMGSAMKVFSIESTPEKMQETASQLIGIANTTALQAHDLRIALGTVGRGASAAAQQLDEVLIMMGLVKNTGVDATVAASSVSSALLYMSENASKFKKLGVDVEDANGKIRRMGDIFLDLNKVLADNPSMTENITVIKDLLQRFGITAYQGVVTQLTKGGIEDRTTGELYKNVEALDYLRDAQARFARENLVGDIAEKMLQGWERVSARFDTVLETLKITIGRGFLEVVLPAFKLLVDGMMRLENFLRELPMPVKTFGAAIALFGSIMTIATGASLIFAGALTVLAAVVFLAGPPLLAWLAAFAAVAIPLTALTLGLTAAFIAFGAGLFFVFTKNLGGANDKLLETMNRWRLIFQATVAFLSEGKLTGALHEEFANADKETNNIVARFYLFFEKLKVGFLSFTETLEARLDGEAVPALQRIYGAFLQLTDALGLTDNAYLKMGEAMSKKDWAAQGAIAADAMAASFVGLCDGLVLFLKLAAGVVEFVQYVWSHKGIILGAVAGGAVAGVPGFFLGAALGATFDESVANLKAREGTTPAYDPIRVHELEAEVEASKMRRGIIPAALPSVTAAELSGDQQQRVYDIWFNKFKDVHDTNSKVYTLENKLYLDGKLVYEAVKEHAKTDAADNFSSDSPWSE